MEYKYEYIKYFILVTIEFWRSVQCTVIFDRTPCLLLWCYILWSVYSHSGPHLLVTAISGHCLKCFISYFYKYSVHDFPGFWHKNSLTFFFQNSFFSLLTDLHKLHFKLHFTIDILYPYKKETHHISMLEDVGRNTIWYQSD